LLLDARSVDRYAGLHEPIDARPGHIPGARSAPFADNLVEPGGRMRPMDELAARYDALGAYRAATVVAYCGSGVTACHDLLALAETGRDDALLYPGSWSEWAADPERPAALGEEPGSVPPAPRM
jgi:thiosulfate/3-mercaptopyruvate sulfurtransferase